MIYQILVDIVNHQRIFQGDNNKELVYSIY
jgi:hypothetical protein